MIVVSDAGPIHYLVIIKEINLLPDLFGTVTIPARVAEELLHLRAPPSVRAFVSTPPDWLLVAPAPSRRKEMPIRDAGEQDAIALGLSLSASFLLMDDRKGVVAARAFGMKTLGTIGILELASRRNLIDVVSAVAKLSATNFRVTPRLVATLLSP